MTRRMGFEEAKVRFAHRFTCEHVPAWALEQRVDGTYYAPQYSTDWEWYLNTTFPGDTGYRRRKYCESRNATWPLGMSLTEPFIGAQ